MLCRWSLHDSCPSETSDYFLNQAFLYGEAYIRFCRLARQEADSLCGDDFGRSRESAWDNAGLTKLWYELHLGHDAKLRQCVAFSRAGRLLELPLELPSRVKAKLLRRFLQCRGTIPTYPHLNTRDW
eukprot:TRINITY_DN32288_c0_g1_i1.p1 TRINITY_DN32288_c0_g1~~TRINITY_DN32288_c0_g1_i1.p1  ORF type:complete len:127 (+),score=9.93 TRINITY_DN32288_c0_g1_i1:484-864(+)